MTTRRVFVASDVRVILVLAVALAVCVLIVDFLTGPKKDDTDAEIRAEQHHTVLWEACTRYAADHSGEYPASLSVLVSEGYADEQWRRYVGRRGVSVEILYRAPAANATEHTIMLYDHRPTYVNLYRYTYVEVQGNGQTTWVYTTSVGGYQDYVPAAQVHGASEYSGE
jgi:hypothetical protein